MVMCHRQNIAFKQVIYVSLQTENIIHGECWVTCFGHLGTALLVKRRHLPQLTLCMELFSVSRTISEI